MADDKKSKRRGLRLWINPALLPTRLAQRVREQQPGNRWIKKSEAAAEGRYLKLAETAFKDAGNSDRPEQEVSITPLL